MEVIMYIGDIIKAFREEHQLSQETFAAKAGLTVSEINTLCLLYTSSVPLRQ